MGSMEAHTLRKDYLKILEENVEITEVPELDIPKEFECRRCGYCCKHFGPELHFTEKDIEMWVENDLDWVFYHPFIDWDLQEFLSPDNGVYFVESVKDARQLLAEKELEYEKAEGYKPDPFPWGGTMRYCTFLKWMGNKWGCLIHEYKSDTCRGYLCYWDRVKAFFSSIHKYHARTPAFS